MNLSIYIPTRGRTSMEHITINEMKRKAKGTPFTIVCPPSELIHYKYEANADCAVLPCPLEGIGPTRQFILEQATTPGVVMLDDDMYFTKRGPEGAGNLIACDNIVPMFDTIAEWLDAGFVHGGISARQGNQHIGYPFTDNIRVNNAHFFNRDVYIAEPYRFDALPVMEDFYITLSLMLRGYPNRVMYDYCWSQRGSGTKGGCSLYRTNEVQAAAAHQLHDLFPDYVKIVTKEAISGGKLFAGERTDVNIQWLKAWADRSSDEHLPTVPLQMKRK